MLKLIIRPELSLIVNIGDEPAAVAVALPNINEALVGLHGKLTPLNLAKLLWRFKVRGPRTARLAILGIRKKYRSVKKYAGLSTFMYAKMNHAGQRCGIDWGELSWTLEDNAPVNVGIKLWEGKSTNAIGYSNEGYRIAGDASRQCAVYVPHTPRPRLRAPYSSFLSLQAEARCLRRFRHPPSLRIGHFAL